ncbi:MAG TPA: molecular chaperone TorD family protein [Enhygromyxa sp.]|nr:molecular chaperone TorD family protein [Enhygromyxa sp.]
MSLSTQQQALARSRLYRLLARLLARGVDRASSSQLEQLGWLPARGVPLEQLAAEHYATFGLGVFPYAGVFLDASASAGACADRVRSDYARAGFEPRLDELAADHLGVQLAFLSFVTGAQADALAEGRPSIAAALDPLLAEFLDSCVLSYLPALVSAISISHSEFWAAIASETLAITAEHRLALPSPITPVALLDVGDPLADPHTGLRQIAEHLLTPAASGVFVSRSDIAAWARQQQLPRGFGSRLLMLDNLLRSAVEYGQLPSLLAALDEALARRDAALAQHAAAYELALAIAPWRAALARTRALLGHLATRALPIPDAPPWTSKPSTTTPPAP